MSEFQFLRDILNELKTRFTNKFNPESFQLKRQLLALDDREKQLLKKKILELEYDLGALNVIKILTETKILSIIDYLQSRENDEEIQGIIADLIDSKGMKELLLDIINNTKSDPKINDQFYSCFTQYCVDVIERPELIKHEFISSLESELSTIEFRDLILSFINILLEYKIEDQQEVLNVFSTQKQVCVQFEDVKYKLLSSIIAQISTNHSGFISKQLCKKLQDDTKFNWFFMLFMIRFLHHSDEILQNEFKLFLKKTFNKFCETFNQESLLMSLIIARQLFFYSPTPFMTYQAWIKSSIGDLNFLLKNPEKFGKALEMLQNSIIYENDHEIIEIHSQTAISSPRLCNHYVLEYKQMLKMKLSLNKDPEIFMDLT